MMDEKSTARVTSTVVIQLITISLLTYINDNFLDNWST